MKILHAASEVFPLAKTGGLSEVTAALPAAQAEHGHDVRVLLPAYRGTAEALTGLRECAALVIRDQPMRLLQGQLPGTPLTVWLLDCPSLYARPGDPYHDEHGHPHGDNAWRFGCFSQAAAQLARAGVDGWVPDIVHAHDWQAGLIPAWLAEHAQRPRTVFTIHNLAYQGVFGHNEFAALNLPAHWWHADIAEFWGQVSFMKAALASADALTTVSPNYAREITTPDFGCALDDRLRQHAGKLRGILNGIDPARWHPARDRHLVAPYSAATLRAGKATNRRALQAELGLALDDRALLVGIISRFAHQKGLDAVLDALPDLLEMPVQLAVLGNGDKGLEAGFAAAAAAHPSRIGLRLGYSEALAHRIEAGADAFLMPSRFEPCGLNQLYSQAYGTVPLVRDVGGLADTVTDASPTALAAGTATGIVFAHSDATGVLHAVQRALALRTTPHWAALQRAGMAKDFSWAHAAQEYDRLYAQLCAAEQPAARRVQTAL